MATRKDVLLYGSEYERTSLLSDLSAVKNYGVSYIDKRPSLSNYWLGKTSVQFYTFLLTLIAGSGKQAEPMTFIDKSLNTVLNGKRYFSYSLGDVFASQHESVTTAVGLRQVGTFLFAPVYNLQKATARPRIWSLSITPVREDGKWGFYAQAIMGHCTTWPMLPYEMLGAVAISQLMVGETGLPLRGVQWFFHQLVTDPQPPDGWVNTPLEEAPDKLPSMAVVHELLAAESKLRRDPTTRPILRTPIDAYSIKYLENLQIAYVEKRKRETPNVLPT
jgi:hypothetical protein